MDKAQTFRVDIGTDGRPLVGVPSRSTSAWQVAPTDVHCAVFLADRGAETSVDRGAVDWAREPVHFRPVRTPKVRAKLWLVLARPLTAPGEPDQPVDIVELETPVRRALPVLDQLDIPVRRDWSDAIGECVGWVAVPVDPVAEQEFSSAIGRRRRRGRLLIGIAVVVGVAAALVGNATIASVVAAMLVTSAFAVGIDSLARSLDRWRLARWRRSKAASLQPRPAR